MIDVVQVRVPVPVIVEPDEDGVWCAHAQVWPGVGANGYGDARDQALDDLKEALVALIEDLGVPPQVTVEVPDAA